MTTKQTFWRTLFAVAAMLLTMPATLWADSAFGGGSGTMADPYLISSPQHLRQLADDVNSGNSYEKVYFELTQNFSCWIEPFTPIGGKYYTDENNSTGTYSFRGSFNGGGHKITDLCINPAEDFYGVGLFGELGYGAHVSDLTIGNLNITSTIKGSVNCGAIAGSVFSEAIIYNCHVEEGVVVSVDVDNQSSTIEDFGGIAGENSGIIGQCSSKATVTNANCARASVFGGIVGSNGGEVYDCISLGPVIGTNHVGGIAGQSLAGSVFYENYFHSNPPVGGVDGADVDDATWMGTISFADGLSGTVHTTPTYSDRGVNYYAAGTACSLGTDVHYNQGFIPIDLELTSEQVTLNADGSFTFPHGQDVVIGATYSSLKRDIAYGPWVEIDIPAQHHTGEPLTPVITVTDVMTGEPVTLVEGTDYTVTLPDGDMVALGDYPITITGIGDFVGTATGTFTIFVSRWLGSGTEDEPYQIITEDDMLRLANESQNESFEDTHFILMNDLDFTGLAYKVVGNSYDSGFKGHFNGNGKTIDNVKCGSREVRLVGLFGYLEGDAIVENLISGAGNVIDGNLNVGGIVGRTNGNVQVIGCTSHATVTAIKTSDYDGRYAGGIVGYSAGGSIVDCRNYGSVNAASFAGGITSFAIFNHIANNINFGTIRADGNLGGIVVGNDYADISNNYYVGDCAPGGIGGSDVAGSAMRGYAVSGGDDVLVELIDEASVGVAVDDVVFAGGEQQVTLKLSAKQHGANNAPALRAPAQVTFVASNGTLTDNGDGTWTLDMPAEEVTISAQEVVTAIHDLNVDRPADDAWYTITGLRLPGKPTSPGIYINGGKKVLVR